MNGDKSMQRLMKDILSITIKIRKEFPEFYTLLDDT